MPASEASTTAPAGGDDRPVLLLSDLHLPPGTSVLRRVFLAFLASPAHKAKTIYILGDLFDAWVGDDLGLLEFKAECEALKMLTASGVEVKFIRGNRDFLVGPRWAAATGVQLLSDPCVAELPSGSTLLSHGDLFCTDDRSYQRYRRVVHNRVLQWLFLHLPARLRLAIAHKLRGHSRARKQHEGINPIGDVSPDAVRAALLNHRQTRLIHGHTHRPARHDITLPDANGCRIVLADWRPARMEYLHCDARGCRGIALPIPGRNASP